MATTLPPAELSSVPVGAAAAGEAPDTGADVGAFADGRAGVAVADGESVGDEPEPLWSAASAWLTPDAVSC